MNYAERIFEVIRSFAIDPYADDIEKMKGEDAVWRKEGRIVSRFLRG